MVSILIHVYPGDMAKMVLFNQHVRGDQKRAPEAQAKRQELSMGEIVRPGSDEYLNLKAEQR
jgi:hypothetical protein